MSGHESAAADWIEDARSRCDLHAFTQLWAQVPESMRLPELAASTVPPQYAGAFCQDGTFRAGVDLTALPEPMRRELLWCVCRIIGLGQKVPTPALSILVRRLGEAVADYPAQRLCSLLELSGTDWCQRFSHGVHRRTGRLPATATTKQVRVLLSRMMRLLVTALDTGPWWQRDRWDPVEEPRIPLREHEPMGRYAVRFDTISTGWLRRGIQWHCKVGLDTGMLTWSTVHRRTAAIRVFDAFLVDHNVPGPHLADDAVGVRHLMLDFLGCLRAKSIARGPRSGQRLSPASVQKTAGDLEAFYAFMTENKDDAAAALADQGWSRLGPEHTRFYRRGELGSKPRPRLEGQIIDDEAMSQVMVGLGLLGTPVEEGGFGDEQAMRITMLMALLGRRVSEICMLDPDPLLPLSSTGLKPRQPGEDPQSEAPVAKLRYQQTKIDGGPDTVLVDAEVVTIIHAQQEWAARHFAEYGAPGKRPKYLFLAAMKNRNGDRPYSSLTLRNLLTQLAERLDIRDGAGRRVDFNRTHRFRHTVVISPALFLVRDVGYVGEETGASRVSGTCQCPHLCSLHERVDQLFVSGRAGGVCA
ncbi:UNVERIFIED_ORG: integrase [Arthrobacter sp. UYEF2]